MIVCYTAVSYTHLDVYKRQILFRPILKPCDVTITQDVLCLGVNIAETDSGESEIRRRIIMVNKVYFVIGYYRIGRMDWKRRLVKTRPRFDV